MYVYIYQHYVLLRLIRRMHSNRCPQHIKSLGLSKSRTFSPVSMHVPLILPIKALISLLWVWNHHKISIYHRNCIIFPQEKDSSICRTRLLERGKQSIWVTTHPSRMIMSYGTTCASSIHVCGRSRYRTQMERIKFPSESRCRHGNDKKLRRNYCVFGLEKELCEGSCVCLPEM